MRWFDFLSGYPIELNPIPIRTGRHFGEPQNRHSPLRHLLKHPPLEFSRPQSAATNYSAINNSQFHDYSAVRYVDYSAVRYVDFYDLRIEMSFPLWNDTAPMGRHNGPASIPARRQH